MSTETSKLKQLLKKTQREFNHQKEIAKIKGETFNIFSILGVERNEVKTHSAFIAELLNPRGSHLQGHIFLDAFLETIEYGGNLNATGAQVYKEKYISRIIDDTGGTIDIFIQDGENQTIVIENKIDATDQDKQLLRYYNHNRAHNTVYYLNLNGDLPDVNSTAGLIVGKDFRIISYQEHIVNWLYRCQELALNVPMLREAIKQYYLLIKKLTSQMIDPKNKKIRSILFEHPEASDYIAENFDNIKNNIKERFRDDVVKGLEKNLDEQTFDLAYPNPVNRKQYSQIFVRFPKIPEDYLQILIESFSGYGHHGGKLMIGIHNFKDAPINFPITGSLEGFDTKYWKKVAFIHIDDEEFSLIDTKFLAKIADPESNRYKRIIDAVVEQCSRFIKDNYIQIEKYFSLKIN
ncbi:MAG: PD-(D/E)XK nuclease family protein [Flavobacteriales bacterium]|nr:PD-(D/E)XK nuclease family protein [Flavobacteriales bacterium]